MHAFAAAQIQRLMVDECEITAATAGPGTLDETTLAVATTDPDVVYHGPCNIAAVGRRSQPGTWADAEVSAADVVVKVPAAEWIDVRAGAIVTVTSSNDPALTGLVLEVILVDLGTNRLSRQIMCRRRQARATTGGTP